MSGTTRSMQLREKCEACSCRAFQHLRRLVAERHLDRLAWRGSAGLRSGLDASGREFVLFLPQCLLTRRPVMLAAPPRRHSSGVRRGALVQMDLPRLYVPNMHSMHVLCRVWTGGPMASSSMPPELHPAREGG